MADSTQFYFSNGNLHQIKLYAMKKVVIILITLTVYKELQNMLI